MGKDRSSTTPRLLLLAFVMAVAWCSSVALADAMEEESSASAGSRREARGRWKWPVEPQYQESNRRTVNLKRPSSVEQPPSKPVPPSFSSLFSSTSALSVRQPEPTTKRTTTTAKSTTVRTTTEATTAAPVVDAETPEDKPKNASSVPLLKDAGKPGNPYVLLNNEFPPQNSIRTQAEEEANLNSLRSKDLGGLEPEEVWLADNDLFVVRGFNYKVDYKADRPQDGPINNYLAPAPNAPPPPEPGTAFYPTNQTVFNFGGSSADYNSTDAGHLNGPSFPYPFLPPPPPEWTEEKEFGNQNQNNNNDIYDPFNLFGGGNNNNFQPQGGQGGPPSSGLNGFPGGQGPPPGGQGQQGPGGGQQGPPPGVNFTIPEDDEDVPFTPLFAERPIEFYFPEHNTTANPPGPFGPGVFVPPPITYFAPRDPNEVLDVKIPEKLFKPPFNLPNYYQKTSQRRPTGSRPSASQQQLFHGVGGHQDTAPVTWSQSTPIGGIQTVKDSHKNQGAVPPTFHGLQAAKDPQSLGVHVVQPVIPSIHQQVQPVLTPTHLDVELHHLYNPQKEVHQHQYHQHSHPLYNHNPYGSHIVPPAISLEGDININYQYPQPAIDPESELIDPLLYQWDPYTIRNPQKKQPLKSYHQQQQPQQQDSSTGNDHPYNFVSVYRLGGGSYSYNLNS